MEPLPFPQRDNDGQSNPSSAAIRCVSPSDGTFLGFIPIDSADEVLAKVSRARKAQRKWKSTSFEQRRTVLRVLRDYIASNMEDLAQVSCLDTGKTRIDAGLGEILTTLEKLRYVLSEGEAALVPERRSVSLLTIHKVAQVEFYPLGVIGAIAPWNYPMHNFFNPVIASIFAGNGVVVKASEYSAWSVRHYLDVVREALHVCGHSADLVQVVNGYGETGAALVESADKIFFTGSTEVGRKVAVAAAQRLVPVVLELGGKDPFVILDDANLDLAVTILMRGVFQNAGQNCIGIERVFVSTLREKELLNKILPIVESLRQSADPNEADVGAMTMGEQAINHIQELVNDAVAGGATLHCGGKRNASLPSGFFYLPTVLSGVTTSMRIAREEVFGPVLTILTYNDEKELVKKVNDCPFGLGSNVYCGNVSRGISLSNKIEAGMGNVNDFAINYMCQSLPFGGMKDSGSDRFAGPEGLRGCCRMKSTTRDRFSFIQTRLPQQLQYPIGQTGWAFLQELMALAYERAVIAKVDNCRNLLVMSIVPRWKPGRPGGGFLS